MASSYERASDAGSVASSDGMRVGDRLRASFRRISSGRRGHSQPQEKDDWGKTPEQQATKLDHFTRALEEKGCQGPFDNKSLLRFLRARDYDVSKSVTMYLQHLAWRKENGVDTIMTDFHFTEREAYLSVYPQGYYKTDKEGRPVSIQHLGKVDPKRINQITSEERMLKYHIQEYERFLRTIAPACSRVAGRHIDQSFSILDVKDVTILKMTGEVRKMVGRITTIAQDHYPETMGKTCIINAPLAFRAVWGIIKPMLQPRTQKKITLLGTKYMDELTKFIDIENIPTYMGGKSPHTLLDDPGPWNDPKVLSDLQRISEGTREADGGAASKLGGAEEMPREFRTSDNGKNSSLISTSMGASPSGSDADGAKHNGGGGDDRYRGMPTLPPVRTRSLNDPGTTSSVQLGGASTPGTLLQRVKALETVVWAQNSETALPDLPAQPPKSLLGRVQLLEDAMATLLAAQEAALHQPPVSLTPAQASADSPKGCCCFM